MYDMTCTRLDIAIAVAKLSRFTSNPGAYHWMAVRRVLKYLKGTIDRGLQRNKHALPIPLWLLSL